jgi:hypothetical protein
MKYDAQSYSTNYIIALLDEESYGWQIRAENCARILFLV